MESIKSFTKKKKLEIPHDVFCFFGLPVDNLTLDSTKNLLREKAEGSGVTVLSTINVNWVVQSFKDPGFRKAILNSDNVVLDGKPLLWLARLMGLPLKEVVPGSTLVEELLNDTDAVKPIRMFLFGGQDGVAQAAMECVNQKNGGLKVVGTINPGFGSIEELSHPDIISAINGARPDLLLVALGAKKGTRWIEYNRDKLNAKVISHLGATINFLAGTVKRAPKIYQRYGIEWVWRIFQEPDLLKRYTCDGLYLGIILIKQLLLYFNSLSSTIKQLPADSQIVVEYLEEGGEHVKIGLGKVVAGSNISSLREMLKANIGERDITFDFKNTVVVDRPFFDLFVLSYRDQRASCRRLSVLQSNAVVSRAFSQCGMHETLSVMDSGSLGEGAKRSRV